MNYRQWMEAGKPFRVADPVANLATILRSYGYTVGTIGNTAHLTAKVPEDHTPYSATGWPHPSEYPWVHACDIMPPPGGKNLPTLAQLGAQIVADRNAGVPSIGWLKYINWTHADGHCVHEKWMPGHTVSASNDTGHIHLSGRTDYTRVPAVYDPVVRSRHKPAPAPAPAARKPAGPILTRVIRLTQPPMHGTDVKAWQDRVRGLGYALTRDGVFGPQSEGALKKFQHDHKLAVDGVLGPASWHAAWA